MYIPHQRRENREECLIQKDFLKNNLNGREYHRSSDLVSGIQILQKRSLQDFYPTKDIEKSKENVIEKKTDKYENMTSYDNVTTHHA